MNSIQEYRKSYQEILGVNERNQSYIRPLNPGSKKVIADNKLFTKRLLQKYKIETPELYKVIRTKRQLQFLDWSSLPKSFVIKPNRGTTGNGIIVLYGKVKGRQEWIRPNGTVMDIDDLTLHMESILEGRFSMGNNADLVLIEERIKNDKTLAAYSYKGVPDVRIVVYNRVPVMAALRIPTKRSDGKANVNAGGIYAGIDIASGLTTSAIARKSYSYMEYDYDIVEETEDLVQNQLLSGIPIPFWDKILEIAVKCQDASDLGFLGVDIVIDREKGPTVLEINARPGLAIQVANMAGLKSRLQRVKGLKIKSIKHGIRVAKDLFGGEIEEEIEALSGKQVVNLVEKVSIYHIGNKSHKKESLNAMLDTGINTSRIDRGIAARIGFADAIKYFLSLDLPNSFESFQEAQKLIDEIEPKVTENKDIVRLAKVTELGKIRIRPVINIKIKIAGVEKEIEAVISTKEELLYPLIIGRAELKGYLIDAGKTFTV